MEACTYCTHNPSTCNAGLWDVSCTKEARVLLEHNILWKQWGVQWDFTFSQWLTIYVTSQDRKQCSLKHTLKHGDLHNVCLSRACIQHKIKTLLKGSEGQKSVRWRPNTISTLNLGQVCVHCMPTILLPITFIV
jgi:hypothetical protein